MPVCEQYNSWLGDIRQTYKAVDVEVIGGVRSQKETVRLVDKYLLQTLDDRSVFAVNFYSCELCRNVSAFDLMHTCLLYTSDAADE